MPRHRHRHKSTGTKIKEGLLGGKGKIKQLPSAYSPQQQNLQNTVLQQLMSYLQQSGLFAQPQQQGMIQKSLQGLSQPQQPQGGLQALQGLGGQQGMYQGGYNTGGGDFAPVAAYAQKHFASDILPGLAERFTAMGGEGTRLGSSAFQGANISAGKDLEEQLSALGAQYGLQQRGLDLQQQGMNQTHLINALRTLLAPQNEFMYQPGKQGFLPALGQGAGALGASYLGSRFF